LAGATFSSKLGGPPNSKVKRRAWASYSGNTVTPGTRVRTVSAKPPPSGRMVMPATKGSPSASGKGASSWEFRKCSTTVWGSASSTWYSKGPLAESTKREAWWLGIKLAPVITAAKAAPAQITRPKTSPKAKMYLR
jgi:hypothetical protein